MNVARAVVNPPRCRHGATSSRASLALRLSGGPLVLARHDARKPANIRHGRATVIGLGASPGVGSQTFRHDLDAFDAAGRAPPGSYTTLCQDNPERAAPPLLHVCITCRAGRPLVAGVPVAGQQFYDAVGAALACQASPAVRLAPVKCLAACDHGCAAAIASPGKWSTLLGRLSPDLASDLLLYGAAYAASASGAVLPSRRPASLARVVLGRLPASASAEAAA